MQTIKPKQIIYIEGSIGAGKSMFIEQLKSELKSLKVQFIPEPLNIWSLYTNREGKSILQLFYEDKKQFSLKFQLILLKSLIDQFKLVSQDCDIIIVERSTESQRNIFVQEFINTGIMDQIDVKIYESFRNDLWIPVQQQLIEKGFIFKRVYIQTSVEKCFQRIKLRNRPGEQDISLEYLQHLEDLHESWLFQVSHKVINNTQDGPISSQSIKDLLQ